MRIIVPLLLEGAGCLAAALEEDRAAVQLWAAATEERDELSGFVNMPADERLLDARVAKVRARIDPRAFADAWAEGVAYSQAESVEVAMALARSVTV